MIRFPCPVCQKRCKAPADAAGSQVRCPRCYSAINVPAQPVDQPTNGNSFLKVLGMLILGALITLLLEYQSGLFQKDAPERVAKEAGRPGGRQPDEEGDRRLIKELARERRGLNAPLAGKQAEEKAADKQAQAPAEQPQAAPQAKPPVVEAPAPRPGATPGVAPQKPETKAPPKEPPARPEGKQGREAPAPGKEAAPPAAKPVVVAPKPPLVLRYRPRTFPVHVAETDTRALEAVADKYGLLYSCALAERTPVSGLQWYAYQFQYRWYAKSLDSPEQLSAMEAELEGLWERFGFRVEVSRE